MDTFKNQFFCTFALRSHKYKEKTNYSVYYYFSEENTMKTEKVLEFPFKHLKWNVFLIQMKDFQDSVQKYICKWNWKSKSKVRNIKIQIWNKTTFGKKVKIL